MSDVSNIQNIITTRKVVPPEFGFQERTVDFDWHGETTPLVVPDKLGGEWHLQTADLKQNGCFALRYCYHSPRVQWCIIAITCAGRFELADSRYWDQAVVAAQVKALNETSGRGDTSDRFKVQEIK
jgi:hypothetical protein